MIRKAILGLVALLGACQQTDKADAPAALSLRVEPQGAAAVQRIELPAAVLAASQRADRGDLRLIDGRGKQVPLALYTPGLPDTFAVTTLPAYPVARTASEAKNAAVSIDLAQPGQTVTISAQGQPVVANRSAVLFDTRSIVDPASSIELDAVLPAQTPVTFTLESSADLKNWEPLADKVLFAPEAGAKPLGNGAIDLGGASLAKRFVRVSWDSHPEMSVDKASVFTARTKPIPPLSVATKGAKLDDPHNLRFAAPFAASLAGVELSAAAADGVVPVRLYGRDAVEQPWAVLGAATLRPGKPARFDLSSTQAREYRIEADARSAGFSGAPALTLLLGRVDLIAAFNGQPPYRLTLGEAKAASAFFQATDLLEPGSDVAALPAAKLEALAPPVVALGKASDDGPLTPRKLALWGALLMATAVLALGAYRLMKANAAAAASPPTG